MNHSNKPKEPHSSFKYRNMQLPQLQDIAKHHASVESKIFKMSSKNRNNNSLQNTRRSMSRDDDIMNKFKGRKEMFTTKQECNSPVLIKKARVTKVVPELSLSKLTAG